MNKADKNKKLLITGASGFLGQSLMGLFRSGSGRFQRPRWTGWTELTGWTAVGTVYSQGTLCSQEGIVEIDLTDTGRVNALFQDLRPDAVIHTAAMSNPNECAAYPDVSHRINVTAVAHLAGLCAENDVPFVFTSTDLVFDGLNPRYDESAAVSPVSLYGEQKVLAEQRVLDVHPGAAVCRMPLMYGFSKGMRKNFFQVMIESFQKGDPVRLFTDEFRTPLAVFSAACALTVVLMDNMSGTIHLPGPERLSRFDLGRVAAQIFGFPDTLIIPTRQKDVPMAAARPPDVSLSSRRPISSGLSRITTASEIRSMMTQMKIVPTLERGNDFQLSYITDHTTCS